MHKLIITNTNDCHRRSIRLQNYDYTSVCTLNRQICFGNIANGKMHLNKYGEIVTNEWLRTAKLRANVKLDDFVVMPDHFHGIIVLTRGVGAQHAALLSSDAHIKGAARCAPTGKYCDIFCRKYGNLQSGSISAIIRAFKSAACKSINETQNCNLKLWQRNYYERIIRDEYELYFVREYIKDNPIKWNAS